MFAQALAPRVRAATEELRKHLRRISSIDESREEHEARIAAKRLRYLLEPIMKVVPGVVEIVDRLKSLQDVLGDLHDAQVFGDEIVALSAKALNEPPPNAAATESDTSGPADDPAPTAPVETTVPAVASGQPTDAPAPIAAEPVAAVVSTPPMLPRSAVHPAAKNSPPGATPTPDIQPGLAAITDRLRDRASAAYLQFSTEWLGDGATAFFRDLAAIADRIGDTARADLEIERKYLLSVLPDEARQGRHVDIAQGYIPGDRLNERLRRVTRIHPGGRKEVHFYRTVKLGDGVSRTEIEEETTEAIFLAMWPLTRRRRLRKRRFEVDVDGHTWQIDDFKHRHLVLAEIELVSEDDDVEFPDWLAPAVQREVTGEPEFQNINLAR
jgi:CYTH domain-containing protein